MHLSLIYVVVVVVEFFRICVCIATIRNIVLLH